MKEREMAYFCKQLAKVAKAGMSFDEGIKLLSKGEEKNSRAVKVKNRMKMGLSFIEAFEKEKELNPGLIEMINLGQETGNLEIVFNELSQYFNKEAELKEMVRGIIYYPTLLGSMLLVVLYVLMVKVLPIFEMVFKELGLTPNSVIRWLFQMNQSIGMGILCLLIGGMLVLSLLFMISSLKMTEGLWRCLMSRSKVTKMIGYVRLTKMMGLAISSGMDLHSALKKGQILLRSNPLSKKLRRCEEVLNRTYDFSEALQESELFPQMITNNIILGLINGNLEDAFEEAAIEFKDQLERVLEKRLAIIEPILVGAISLVTVSILVSVMLPLMSIMNVL